MVWMSSWSLSGRASGLRFGATACGCVASSQTARAAIPCGRPPRRSTSGNAEPGSGWAPPRESAFNSGGGTSRASAPAFAWKRQQCNQRSRSTAAPAESLGGRGRRGSRAVRGPAPSSPGATATFHRGGNLRRTLNAEKHVPRPTSTKSPRSRMVRRRTSTPPERPMYGPRNPSKSPAICSHRRITHPRR